MIHVVGIVDDSEKFYQPEVAQGIANIFPEYKFARASRYSNVQSAIAPVAEIVDELFLEAKSKANPFNILKSYNNELLEFFPVSLPDSWQFDYVSKADRTNVYIPPLMIGSIGATQITVDVGTNNSINSYKKNIPTRLSVDFDTRLINGGQILSGMIYEYKTIVNSYLKSDSYLFINIDSVPDISVDFEGVPYIVIVGRNYSNVEVVESVEITRIGTHKTKNRFVIINSMYTVGLDSGLNVDVYDYPVYIDNNSIAETALSFYDRTRQEGSVDLFYKINTTAAGDLLQYYYHADQDDQRLSIENFSNRWTINNFELYDTNGTRVSQIDSIVPSNYNSDIYVISGNRLFIFDKRSVTSPLLRNHFGYDEDPDSFLIVDLINKQRTLYDSGTGATTDLANSVRFTDGTKTWTVNEHSGKSLLLSGIEYLILSNTADTLTVSANTSAFEYISDIAPAATSYEILAMPIKLSPIRLKGGRLVRRIKISFEHESGITFYFNDNTFTEDDGEWLPNPLGDSRISFNYGTFKTWLPFTGSYRVSYEVEYQNDNVLETETFKMIIDLGEKRAKAQFNLAPVGADVIAGYIDYGDLVLVFDQDVTVSMSRNGGTTDISPTTDSYSSIILSEISIGIIPGSVTVADGSSTWTDDGAGLLISGGAPAVDGVINYTTGAFTLNWTSGNQPSGANIGITYDYTEISEQICTFHKDYAVIDFIAKQVYFFEQYDSVDIENTSFEDGGVTPSNTIEVSQNIEDFEGTWP